MAHMKLAQAAYSGLASTIAGRISSDDTCMGSRQHRGSLSDQDKLSKHNEMQVDGSQAPL